jgi:glycosyltransferase involved in cell wall biosynthesis
MKIAVIIPAYNEEPSIGRVIAAIPRPPVDDVIVANNDSRVF